MSVIYKIFYNFFLLVIISISFSKITYSLEYKSCHQYNFIENNDFMPIKEIQIKINKYKKWQINNMRILTNTSYLINEKNKKKFSGKLLVKYINNSECIFKAKIRTQGDLKDHIYYDNGKIFQSLDVELLDGNINNITRFKLFLENTRGNKFDEIFMTELLREFDYLAPRTQLVKVKINDAKTEMIFQEKISKELLEYNKRREGPILEGDEKFMMQFASKVKNIGYINWSEIFRVSELGTRIQLSKLNNSNWAMRNESFKNIAHQALDKLNLTYLIYLNNYKNNFSFLDYNLNNISLSQNNKSHERKLNIYNNLILAANGHHGLYAHNRKFYWNSFENYFEPIYYDGEFDIFKQPSKIIFPIEKDYLISINDAKNLIFNLNKKNFLKKLKLKNFEINENLLDLKLQKLVDNLNLLEKFFLEIGNKDLESNNDYKYEILFERYLDNLEELNINYQLIKFDNKNKNYFSCEKKLEDCFNKINFNELEEKKLLEGDLVIDNIYFSYIVSNQENKHQYKKILLNDDLFDNVLFYHNGLIDYEYDKYNKLFTINQKDIDGRAFFLGGNINEIKIRFEGKVNFFENKLSNQYDENINLTGCMTFYKTNFENTDILVNNSVCEDGVNIISSIGNIKNIKSKNSLFDGYDFDFSNISIENVEISDSLNDCIDFSGGGYSVLSGSFLNCGDKGVSVGESSWVDLSNIVVANTNIGIASKDSSKTIVNQSKLSYVNYCFAAYKKKQEYNGGYIKSKNSNCLEFKKQIFEDDFSKIEIQ